MNGDISDLGSGGVSCQYSLAVVYKFGQFVMRLGRCTYTCLNIPDTFCMSKDSDGNIHVCGLMM